MNRLIYMICMCLCFAQAHAFVFTKERVRIMDSEGYLLIPQLSPSEHHASYAVETADSMVLWPAVLLLHDHGAWFSIGKEKMIKPLLEDNLSAEEGIAFNARLSDAQAWVNKCYDSIFVGDSLAALGYVVLCVDAPGWGSMLPVQPDWIAIGRSPDKAAADSLRAFNKRIKNAQPTFYQNHFNQTGCAWFEHTLALDKACVTFLQSLPCVNREHIACFGFSMGAYRAWQLAAEDERIAACIASNWMTTIEQNGGVLPNVSAYSMFRPDCKLDYPSIAAKIAPRPFVLMYGDHDHLFPTSAVEEAVSVIKHTYQLQGAEQAFSCLSFPVDHFFSHKQFSALHNALNEFIPNSSYETTPLQWVGHRGSIWGVENTKEAFLAGVARGYDALECDVRTTADGQFVLSHDETLDRLGCAGKAIAALPYDSLRMLTLTQVRAGVEYKGSICLLSEYLKICKQAGKRAVVELKWATGVNSNDQSMMPQLMQVIEQENMLSETIILTSMRPCLEWLRNSERYQDVQLMWLCTPQTEEKYGQWAKDLHLDIDIRRDYNVHLYQQYKNDRLKLGVWTVNEMEEAQRLAPYSDYITTDSIAPFRLPPIQ